MGGNIIIKEWEAVSFKWRLERDRFRDWFYLIKDNKIVAEGPARKKKELLNQGWYE